uniref:Uncharacterized protein n=1 Tax=Magallana gigas TaxID=29159 RepID=K1Q144_MAGGI
MSLNPANPAWIAGKAIDGNTNQNYTSNSCAITDIPHHHTNNESVWWKVWLDRPFNVTRMLQDFQYTPMTPKFSTH